MKSMEIREKFVELRAQGRSFASIAEELNVSKPTLIEWSREFHERVMNLRAINDEALRERYRITKERQLALLTRQLEAVERELESRPLADVSTDKLYGVMFKLVGELREQTDKSVALQFTHDDIGFDDVAVKSRWEG